MILVACLYIGKAMAFIFWDAEGILFIDFLPKDRTINSEYYCDLLEQLREAIDKKRPGKIERGVIFHQCNLSHYPRLHAKNS